MKWCPRQELHLHSTASETVVSAVGLRGHETGSLGWICTTNPPLQRRMLSLLSYKAVLKWSVRLELHQHPSGYEPGALLLSYGPKMVGYPGAAPGYSCFQGKRVLLALSYPMKSGRAPRTRTGLHGLANHWLDDFAVRTLEMVPSAGSAPAPLRSQRRMLLLHYEGSVEMDPPVGFAPT